MNKKLQISKNELMSWCERVAMLTDAGVSLTDSLDILIGTSSSKKMGLVNSVIHRQISNGESLSSCFSDMRGVDRNVTYLIRIGEKSGSLGHVLKQIHKNLKEKQEINRKVFGAMLYPAVIALATLSVAGFMVFYIFPKVMPLFVSMNISLPLPTRVLLYSSNFFSLYWIWILVGIFVFFVLSYLSFKRFAKIRNIVEIMKFKIPLFRSIFLDSINSQIFGITSLMLDHGISLPDSMRETSESVRSGIHQAILNESAVAIDDGRSCLSAFSKYPAYFSRETLALVNIAEKTGELASIFSRLKEISANNVERMITNMTRLIEPALMIFMGLVVGSIALSIIMPIYEITNKMSH